MKKCNHNNGLNLDNLFVLQDDKYKYNNNSLNKVIDGDLNSISNNLLLSDMNNELTHRNDNLSVNDFFSTSCLFN